MATRVYTWTDGGGTGAWNNASNWSGVGSGYPGSNSPTDTDSVIFDSTSTNDCSMNATTTINLMLIDTGYTGTITQTQGLTIDDAVLGGHLTINEGTLDTDGNGLYIDGDVEIDGSSSMLDASGGGAVQMRSLQNTGGGDYSATDHAGGTVITGRNAGTNRAIQIGGDTIIHNDGLFVIQGTSAGNTDLAVGVDSTSTFGFYDVEIDASTYTIALNSALSIYNDLTITAGTLTTAPGATHYALAVSGTTTIGSADASAVDEATLITNESTIDLRGTNNTTPGLLMLAGGTFNGVGDANHSIGSVNAQTTTYNSKIYLTSGTTTIYQEDTGNHAWSTYSNADVNIYHGNGTVKFTAGTYVYVYNNAVAGGDNSFYNVIIDHDGAAGQRVALSGDVVFSVINDLTVSDGDFYTGGAGHTYVGNDCLVDNGATHVFNTSGALNRPFTVLGELTVREDSTYLAGDESNTFGALTLSGNSTFNASTGVTMLSGNVGSTNEAGYTWTPFYQRGSATFNHNNGTFHNKSAKGYVAYQQYGSRVGPFYNYIQDFVAESAHTFNTDIIIEGDATMSGTCSLNGGVWGLRNENQYDFFVSGNLILLSGSGVGGGWYQNTATPKMITEGNIIMHPDSKLTTATGSLGPGWEIGGNLINNGGYIY